ncbi:methyltransferase [Cytobacillus sp. FJAT-54145]|uniref:Methyltransferase n=1 Tax=Cytobacillus spartinae TaxID=3299023 RepID=A0ABW6KD69_9BACI
MFILNSIVFSIVFFSFLSIVYATIKNGISPMPTLPKVKRILVENLPSEPVTQIAELGAGWGTLAFQLAKKFPSATITAFENSLIPYTFIVIRKWLFSQTNLIVLRKNFYKSDLSKYNLIVCYLYPGAMTRLEKQFHEQLTKETMVVSHTFAVPNRKPSKTIIASDFYQTRIYFYEY